MREECPLHESTVVHHLLLSQCARYYRVSDFSLIKNADTNAATANAADNANDACTASSYEARTIARTAGSRSSSEASDERTLLAICTKHSGNGRCKIDRKKKYLIVSKTVSVTMNMQLLALSTSRSSPASRLRSRTRRRFWTRALPPDIPITDPNERKRYETAWMLQYASYFNE